MSVRCQPGPARTCQNSHQHHCIFQETDPADFDFNVVVGLECKVVWWHNAGAAQEDRAMGKRLAAEEESGELIKASFNLVHHGLAGKYRFAIAADFETDGPVAGGWFSRADMNPGTERARASVDFCLG